MNTTVKDIHNLFKALDLSRAEFGNYREWTDKNIRDLSQPDLLGKVLDLVRGDAKIIPEKRFIDQSSIKVGDKDETNHRTNRATIEHDHTDPDQQHLILGKFELEIIPPHPDPVENLKLDKELLLPMYLRNKYNLPGIALRNFYIENPQHIPKCFSGIVLFWGTICKDELCYYVPGIDENGAPCDRHICNYSIVNGKETIKNNYQGSHHNAAVFRSHI